MNARWKLPVSLAVAAWLLCATTASAAPLTFSFSLLPADGAIAGEAGATIGWGYTITNESDELARDLRPERGPLPVRDAGFVDLRLSDPGAGRLGHRRLQRRGRSPACFN